MVKGPYSFDVNGINYPSGHEVSGLFPTEYLVQIFNRNSCLVDSLNVLLQQAGSGNCDSAYVPTAFTPNNDGKTTCCALLWAAFHPAFSLMFTTGLASLFLAHIK